MSVIVNYKGRFGNHVFQYIAARLFSEANRLKLLTEFDGRDLIDIEPQLDGSVISWPEVTVTDFDDIFGRAWAPARYLFDGFFQNSDWFYHRRDHILRFAKVKPIVDKNSTDIVMNVRLGDFKAMGWVIDPSWYLDVLKMEQFERLHIVTDEIDQEYYRPFMSYNPIFVSSGKNGDWDYLRSFDRVVCSNSTFCWWAMFFTPPKKMYVFKRWVGLPGNNLSIPGSIELDGKFLREIVKV